MNLIELRSLAKFYDWQEISMSHPNYYRFTKNRVKIDIYISKYEFNGITLEILQNGSVQVIRNVTDDVLKRKFQILGDNILKEENLLFTDKVIIRSKPKGLRHTTKLWFGKYKGKELGWVIEEDPQYYKWMQFNFKNMIFPDTYRR